MCSSQFLYFLQSHLSCLVHSRSSVAGRSIRRFIFSWALLPSLVQPFFKKKVNKITLFCGETTSAKDSNKSVLRAHRHTPHSPFLFDDFIERKGGISLECATLHRIPDILPGHAASALPTSGPPACMASMKLVRRSLLRRFTSTSGWDSSTRT